MNAAETIQAAIDKLGVDVQALALARAILGEVAPDA